MGIRLDWQVESEQSQLRATEDPGAKLRRQQARRKLIALLAGLIVVLGGVGLVVAWRLWRVDNQLRQDLIDTVQVEVTALRIGDFVNYMSIQRSASEAFLLEQSHRFEEYQDLKQTHRVELTGDVLAVEIDEQRGRVVLQEMIDGVPYKVVWFYWYYEDASEQSGWRHVPDDLTFWGDEREIEAGPVLVRYRDLDRSLAAALAARLEDWWTRGCALLGCAVPPPDLRVQILAERPKQVGWQGIDAWTLNITSPLVGRSRADQPLSPELEYDVAAQIAARLVSYAANTPDLPTYGDAAWLQSELAAWLTDSLLGTTAAPGEASFVQTLVDLFGPGAPATLLAVLPAGPGIDSALSVISGVPLAQLTDDQLNHLNWRRYFQWRLELEPRLVAQPDLHPVFLTLYDLDNLDAATIAETRRLDPATATSPPPEALTATISREGDQVYASVSARRAETGEILPIVFRLAGGTWKRRN